MLGAVALGAALALIGARGWTAGRFGRVARVATLLRVVATVALEWLAVEVQGRFERGWASLRRRSLDMCTLVALGTGVAWLFSAVATVAPGASRQSFVGRTARSRPWDSRAGERGCDGYRGETTALSRSLPLLASPRRARRPARTGRVAEEHPGGSDKVPRWTRTSFFWSAPAR
ncbi:hypothetical protein [Roseicella aquatilis]|uniref:Uncharacterized protein n=1 Tax=Roseicella aquatilis TaxID=2527868 RepID=A0A4R4D442_9PROT|nr:hypothetical protein [Roseicella aquatilis]TCZ52285.1 hypothetical protein EXY23_26295 [Roseicella aquatilis]